MESCIGTTIENDPPRAVPTVMLEGEPNTESVGDVNDQRPHIGLRDGDPPLLVTLADPWKSELRTTKDGREYFTWSATASGDGGEVPILLTGGKSLRRELERAAVIFPKRPLLVRVQRSGEGTATRYRVEVPA